MVEPQITDVQASLVLGVNKIDPFSKVMAIKLQNEGFKVEIADNLPALKEITESVVPDVVLIDGVMEYAPEVRQWLKSSYSKQLCSLIAYYPEGYEYEKINGFKVIEDEYVIEPYEIKDLSDKISSEYKRLLQERKYFVNNVKIECASTPIYVQEAGNFIEKLLKSTKMEEDEFLAVVNAAREAIDNASRHGNKSNPEKKVSLEYLLDSSKITISVKDEGEGFDTAGFLGDGVSGDAVSVARKRQAEGKVGGLGVMLMLRCVDKVEYNRKGNMITLTKTLNKAAVA
ncbi:MAG: ATP-binding protein [Planctomycetota bacterium]|jgi:serine/threonine-protein kinase RsbW